MLKDHFKKIAKDEKIVDENDFWLIENNPMTKIGVFPYLGSQISPELEPDKVYQVLRPKEELTKPETLKSLELIPLVDEHTMLGTQPGFQPAEEKGIHGVTGTNVTINDETISNDLKVFSESLKEEIKNGKKGLSLGYKCTYDLTSGEYKGQPYEAVQRDLIFNHLALVDEGRMGKDVRVMDKSITYDSISDILQKKEKDNMADEKQQAQDVDKRELIREVMAISAKPDSDFEGGEEEKIETIAKKLEEMAYNPSESGANDEEIEPLEVAIKEGEDEDETKCGDEDPTDETKAEDDDEDKRKLIDEIGGILKGKVDEELWRTVIGKAEKLAYNDSETGANDEDPEKEDDKKDGVSMDEAIKYLAKKDALVKKIRIHVGDSALYPQMTIKQVVKYACDKLRIKNSLDCLEGYLKAKSQLAAKVSMDSAFMTPAESSVIKQYKNQK